MVGASIETHGEIARLIAPQLGSAIISNLGFTLVRAPFWFVGSALAVALGRHLNAGPTPLAASTVPTTHPETVD
jgi:hypothetical protein